MKSLIVCLLLSIAQVSFGQSLSLFDMQAGRMPAVESKLHGINDNEISNQGTNSKFIDDVYSQTNKQLIDPDKESFYWVNGSGVWSDFFNHWADSSGGIVKVFGKVPDAGDTVYFDDNSFKPGEDVLEIQLDENAECFTLDFSKATKKIIFTKQYNLSLKIYGSLYLNPIMDFNVQGEILFEGMQLGNKIFSAGKQLPFLMFNGLGGGWELEDNLYCEGLQHYAGAFKTNGYELNCYYFEANVNNKGELDIENSKVIVRTSNWSAYPGYTNMNAKNSEIYFESQFAFYSGDYTYHNVYFTQPQATPFVSLGKYNKVVFYGNANINNDCIFDTLVFSPGKIYSLEPGRVQTINKYFDARGNTCFPIYIKSSIADYQTEISKSSDDVICDFLSITNIKVSGGATFYAGGYTKTIGTKNEGWIYSNAPDYVYGFGPDTVLCEGDVLQTYNFNGAKSYLWMDGSTESSHTIEHSGTYWVQVTYGDNCIYADTINVEIVSNAFVNAGNDLYVCQGNTPQNVAVSIRNEIAPYEISWDPQIGVSNPNSSETSISSDISRRYVVSVLSANGCYARDTIWYYVIDQLKPTITQNRLKLLSNYSAGNQWYLDGEAMKGEIYQELVIKKSGIYTLVITDKYGCRSQTSEPLRINIEDYLKPIISIDNKSALAGEMISFNFEFKNKQMLIDKGIDRISYDLEFNPTLLAIVDRATQIKSQSSAVVHFDNIEVAQFEAIMSSLVFHTGLGNAKYSDVNIQDIINDGADEAIWVSSGKFTLLGICEEGGTRLINPNSNIGIQNIVLNATKTKLIITAKVSEAGSRIKLYALDGRLIEEIECTVDKSNPQDFAIDITKIPAGMYIVEYQSPTYREIEKILIEK